MLILPAPLAHARAPFRRQNVLYVGVHGLRAILESQIIPLARCENDEKAVCLSRCFRTAMLFANKNGGWGGVLALDRDALRARYKIIPHRDTVLTLKTRAAGYDEHEERVLVPITGFAPYLLGAWENTAIHLTRLRVQNFKDAGFLMEDDGVDWDAVFHDDFSDEADAA